MAGPLAALRDLRYALPGYVGRILPGPSVAATARRCAALNRKGLAATVGYFDIPGARPEDIVAANIAIARRLADGGAETYLSVKAPPLDFAADRLRTVAEAGLTLLFDAHAPRDADRTLDLVAAFLSDFPGTGFALPARWRRSPADAAAFRETSARIRLVKGEWADPDWPEADAEASYLGLAARLAGREAPVAVATHDPYLAERALTLLVRSGTPCELEQLRGLPSRRTTAVARRLGVKVRVYVPFGPGWWPYALDKTLARPYLLRWMISDRLGSEPAVRPTLATET